MLIAKHALFQFPLSDLSPCEEKTPLEGLEEGVLARNLGLDVVVVLTKSDAMTQLEAEHGLTDQHFDFLQQAVRKFCLTFGASLFYTSVKEDKNCDLLYKYLVHTSYGFPLTTPALVVERDALFVPAGWDSTSKISILHENLFKFTPDQNFGEVIKSPFATGKGNKILGGKNVEVVAEAEQDFLARLAPFLLQEGLPSSPLSSHLHHSTESVLKTPERRLAGSPGVHSALKRSEFGPGKTPNDGAISNFFHALLQKKTGSTTQLPVVEPADILLDRVSCQILFVSQFGFAFNFLFAHRQQRVRQNYQKIVKAVPVSKRLSNKWSQAPVILEVEMLTITVRNGTEAQKYQNTSQITQVTIL